MTAVLSNTATSDVLGKVIGVNIPLDVWWTLVEGLSFISCGYRCFETRVSLFYHEFHHRNSYIRQAAGSVLFQSFIRVIHVGWSNKTYKRSGVLIYLGPLAQYLLVQQYWVKTIETKRSSPAVHSPLLHPAQLVSYITCGLQWSIEP